MRKEILINCGNLLLEGIVELPDNTQTPVPGAVICHPHPLYGGTMHNNVTRVLKNGFLKRGIAALRFNFRGTGQSEGKHGNGIDEMEDVRAALDHLEGTPGVDPTKLLVAGYSFGCWVGLRTAHKDVRPTRLIGVSPPLDSYDFGFLKSDHRPKLLVVGDRDFVCSIRSFERFFEELPEPKMASILRGVDHFHGGAEQNLVSIVDSFLDLYPFQTTA